MTNAIVPSSIQGIVIFSLEDRLWEADVVRIGWFADTILSCLRRGHMMVSAPVMSAQALNPS